MNILIAGGTGLIGSSLIDSLHKAHHITVITRDVARARKTVKQAHLIDWNKNTLKNTLKETDLVINLCGQSIGDSRWSTKTKKAIIDSRVNPTALLCALIHELDESHRPRLFNASAIGIYGLQKTLKLQNEIVYDETSALPKPPQDFLSEVGQAWEAVLDNYPTLDIVRLRFAVVLSPIGGMLKKVLLPFKLGLGGRIGSGAQPFSWIAIEDVVGIIKYLINHKDITGPINLVAPDVISQHDFASQLAKRLKRPALIPMPSVMVRLLFGEMGQTLLLSGQSVSSQRLKEYPFKFKTLNKALPHWAL